MFGGQNGVHLESHLKRLRLLNFKFEAREKTVSPEPQVGMYWLITHKAWGLLSSSHARPCSPSLILPAKESALKPANTTVWTAPILAQASIAATASGDTGMYMATRSPRCTPCLFSVLARRHVVSRSSLQHREEKAIRDKKKPQHSTMQSGTSHRLQALSSSPVPEESSWPRSMARWQVFNICTQSAARLRLTSQPFQFLRGHVPKTS